MSKKPELPSELRAAVKTCRRSFLTAGFFSLFINLLMLVPALYMLQMYDRVLTSRSESTLLLLTLLVVGLMITLGALDWVRSQILIRVGARLDMALNERLFTALFDLNLRRPGSAGVQPINDLTQLRQFLTGAGLAAFFDVPWIPLYILVLFLFHPLFGWMALGGTMIAFGLTLANELSTQKLLAAANTEAIAANQYAGGNLRNAEVLEAMGMLGAVRQRWLGRHTQVLNLQARASDRAGALTATSRGFRILLQSLVLGAGAYLAIHHVITPGLMIAASILTGRALAPIDLLVGNWRGFVSARSAYRRLDQLLQSLPQRPAAMSLPPPQGNLHVDGVTVIPPGASTPAIRGVSFTLKAGESMGIVGPTASGKSTLARALLGLWPAYTGKVRLDGVDAATWNREELGPFIGYLPQDIELFSGTISENIARFGTVDPGKVVEAARRAGVHELILRLPKGYDTPIGEAGCVLSGGQCQRIALARALYGDPVLVVLDEPNSNLDDQGEAALVAALKNLKERGRTLLIITHRPSVLAGVDKMLVLKEGQVQMVGPCDQVMAKLIRPAAVPAGALAQRL